MLDTTIPHPRFRLPVLGDVLTIDFARPVQGLTAELHRAGNEIVQERLFNVTITALGDAAMIEEVNNEAVWEKHTGRVMAKLRPVAGDGLITANNDEPNWRKAHNILMPAFTKAAMIRYHDAMTATVAEFLEAWSGHAAEQSWIDVATDTNRLTIELIARAALSHSFTRPGDTDGPAVLAALQRELRYATRRTDAIPLFDDTLGFKRKRQHLADTALIRGHVADLIDHRRRHPTAGDDDILDIMLNNADPDTGDKLDDDNLINQVLTLIAAGSETSANTMAFALHLLATHPQIAEKARREIDALWPSRSVGDIEFADIAKLRYVRRVVDETLRLWPVAAGYFRQARHDTTLGDGKYRFHKGDWVLVLLTAAHRSPAWGADAQDFNPDRFLPDSLRTLPAHIYKPFGTGPRACIGRQFALHEIVLTLAALLQRFDLEAEPDYQLKIFEAITLRPVGLNIRVHNRQ